MSRRIFMLAWAAFALGSVGTNPGNAQSYPVRPVRLIVPYPAGGSTDVAARIIGEYLSRAMGQQIYIENRSGAAGVLGIEAVAKSAPDGYTILVGTDFVASAAHVFNMTVDPLRAPRKMATPTVLCESHARWHDSGGADGSAWVFRCGQEVGGAVCEG